MFKPDSFCWPTAPGITGTCDRHAFQVVGPDRPGSGAQDGLGIDVTRRQLSGSRAHHQRRYDKEGPLLLGHEHTFYGILSGPYEIAKCRWTCFA